MCKRKTHREFGRHELNIMQGCSRILDSGPSGNIIQFEVSFDGHQYLINLTHTAFCFCHRTRLYKAPTYLPSACRVLTCHGSIEMSPTRDCKQTSITISVFLFPPFSLLPTEILSNKGFHWQDRSSSMNPHSPIIAKVPSLFVYCFPT